MVAYFGQINLLTGYSTAGDFEIAAFPVGKLDRTLAYSGPISEFREGAPSIETRPPGSRKNGCCCAASGFFIH